MGTLWFIPMYLEILSKYLSYYPSGKLEFSHMHINDEEHGVCQGWYESGVVQYFQTYVMDKQHGESKWYYPSGKLEYSNMYRVNDMVKLSVIMNQALLNILLYM